MLLSGLALAGVELPGPGWASALGATLAVAWAGAALLWARRYLEALSAPCPRCRRPFFASWERVVWSLPLIHRSCAHCSLLLRPHRR